MVPKYVRIGLLAVLAIVGAMRIAATNWNVLTAPDGSIAIDPLFAISLSLAAIIFFFGETQSARAAATGSESQAESGPAAP